MDPAAGQENDSLRTRQTDLGGGDIDRPAVPPQCYPTLIIALPGKIWARARHFKDVWRARELSPRGCLLRDDRARIVRPSQGWPPGPGREFTRPSFGNA